MSPSFTHLHFPKHPFFYSTISLRPGRSGFLSTKTTSSHFRSKSSSESQHLNMSDFPPEDTPPEASDPSTPAKIPPSAPVLVRFYHPTTQAADSEGRTLQSILDYNDNALEIDHSYIQTLFPLPERSPFQPRARLINHNTFLYFRSDPLLRRELRRAFHRMLTFYGLEPAERRQWVGRESIIPEEPGTSTTQPYEIMLSLQDTRKFYPWASRPTHNHLRMTRIIRSLRILGCQVEAEAFFRVLRRIAVGMGKLDSSTLGFWTRAARRPLNVEPAAEMKDDGGTQGDEWLRGLDDLVGDELENKKLLWKQEGELSEREPWFAD